MFSKCLLLLFCSAFIEAQYPYDHYQRCPYPHLDNGRIRVRQRAKLVKFICLPRYELVGNRYATCKDGRWDAPNPVCVKPGCDSFSVQNAVQIRGHHEAWVTTFCMPGYTLVGSAAVYCNGFKWNATAPRCIEGSAAPQLSCDFEDVDLCGWRQDELHDFDWIRLNSKTPTSFLNTGPSYDHTYGIGEKGYYMYIESTSKLENTTARLLSPVYDSKLALNACFSFYYHMFGKGIGGLRIYQKPDEVQMSDLLDYSDSEKQQYIIFEQWGNLGDFWYSAAAQLKDFKDSFQIVVEGIRGTSFTSDIAIDDVALLQGDNCTYFRNAATTPVPPASAESCAGRCDDKLPVPRGCECSPSCMEKDRCCADYMELCVFDGSVSTTEYSTLLPQTPTEVPVRRSSVTTITPVETTPYETSTVQPTIKEATTLATKPTTKLTTKLTTEATPRPTVKLTTKQTKLPPRPTMSTIPSPRPTKFTFPSPRPAIKTLPPRQPTPSIRTTPDYNEIYKNMSEKEAKVQKNANKLVEISSQSSTWKTAVITVVVLAVLASIIYLAVVSRTNKGRVAIARLRGQAFASNDPEVRYLNSNDDDL